MIDQNHGGCYLKSASRRFGLGSQYEYLLLLTTDFPLQ